MSVQGEREIEAIDPRGLEADASLTSPLRELSDQRAMPSRIVVELEQRVAPLHAHGERACADIDPGMNWASHDPPC